MEARQQGEAGRDSTQIFDQQYLLEGEIGRGRHGVVYRAQQQLLQQKVAIKVLSARLRAGSPDREAFDERMQALSTLAHPNVVHVEDFGLVSGAPYIVMEHIEGETLEALIARGAIDAAAVETLAPILLRGLGYMHARGTVHGELNARHVLIAGANDDAPQLKLIGFRVADASASETETARLMAPELVVGQAQDARSDVYAAGALLRQMLEASGHVAGEAMGGALTLLPGQATASQLDSIVAIASADEPQERFADADEMLKALLALPTPWFTRAEVANDVASEPPPLIAPLRIDADEVAELDVDELEEVADAGPEPAAAPDTPQPTAAVQRPRRISLRALKLAALGVGLSAIAATASLLYLQRTRTPAEPPVQAVKQPAAPPPSAAAASQAQANASPASPAANPPSSQPTAAKDENPAAVSAKHQPTEPSQPVASKQEPPPPALPAQEPPPPTLPAQAAPAQEPAAAKPPPAPLAEHPAPIAATPVTKPGPEQPNPAQASDAHAPKPASESAPPSAAEPAPKPAPAYRHVQPSKFEIRQLLRLAIGSPKPRGEAKDPWDGKMSKALESLRTSIRGGDPGTPQIVSALRRFNRTNPDAAQGHLLLATLYINRGWPLDALDEFDMAYRVDPSSRGAPEMLPSLLRMVSDDQGAEDAARFIHQTYQREALPAIEAALREHDSDAGAVARLRKLRSLIGPAPQPKSSKPPPRGSGAKTAPKAAPPT